MSVTLHSMLLDRPLPQSQTRHVCLSGDRQTGRQTGRQKDRQSTDENSALKPEQGRMSQPV